MRLYTDLNKAELQDELNILLVQYHDFQQQKLSLNMARGKPSPEQLDLSNALLDILPSDARPLDGSGDDLRNYGNLFGIAEARGLMAQILEVPADEVLIGGNSSLTLMHDTVARSMLHGLRGQTAWCHLPEVKFLCPAPGYDRHFAITESMGIKNIVVPMRFDGPDMDVVEELAANDPAIKGIWCVPKYSNPQGITYSPEVVRRFGQLRPAASDFRIFWDNAYAVHDLGEPGDSLASLRESCLAAGNPDIYYMFCSSSKVTFAGGGISALATSADNLAEIVGLIGYQSIGPDKVNQLRHVAFLGDLEGVRQQMSRHAAILTPKFQAVLGNLRRELGGLGIASWSEPNGGYFISFDGLPGTAARTVELAKQAGVVLTGAGATFPYGTDPDDANIRIAPSYPSLQDLEIASQLFCVCVRMAAIELLLTKA